MITCIVCQVLRQAQGLLAAALQPDLYQRGDVAMHSSCLWRRMHRDDEVVLSGAHRVVLPTCAVTDPGRSGAIVCV